MKIGSLRSLCAAAVAASLAVPAYAQLGSSPGTSTSEGGTRQAPNGTRGAEGETGTVRGARGQNGTGTGAAGATRRGNNPGRTAGAAGAAGTRDTDPAIPGALDDVVGGAGAAGTRTANFPPDGTAGQRGRITDNSLVRWISAGNEGEIQVNEVARQQAQNDQVKQFAEKMVQEHTQLGQKLQQAAHGGQAGTAGAANENSARAVEERAQRRADENVAADAADAAADDQARGDNAGRRNGRDAARGTSEAEDVAEESGAAARARAEARTTEAGTRGGNPLLAFHEEVKRQCTQSTIADLKQKQGAEFDKCFMNQQIVEHMAMLDTLKVAQQHASQNLKPALQEAEQHTQQHLQMAKDIAKQLEHQGQRQ
jgi:predicted outer membrane protein